MKTLGIKSCKGRWAHTASLAAFACAMLTLSAQDVTVYDNLPGTELGRFAALDFLGRPTEFGDEIALAGTARIVTKFIFDYYGNFTPDGDETARIRFYANDAPGVILKPGTLLYDSGTFPIVKGPTRVTLDIPYIEVPNSFTWTVSFSGVTQTPGDSAELILYNPPSVGGQLSMGLIGSYRDYWKYNAGTWTVYMLTNGLPANFVAKVIARNETLGLSVALNLDTGQLRLRWNGKANSHYQIESSSDFRVWTPIQTIEATAEGYIEFATAVNPADPMLFYRVAKLSLPSPRPIMSTKQGATPGTILVSWTGGRELMYQLKYSEDLKNWTYLASVKSDAEGKAEYVDKPPAGAKIRFYRALTPW